MSLETTYTANRQPETFDEVRRDRKVAFKTLGCRLNQYETDALVSDFDKAGYKVVDFRDRADVVVVNTCTVTNQSDQKSRNIINQAIRHNMGSVVVVTGCMANHYREKLEKQEKITYVVENNRKGNILSLVDAHFGGEILHPESLPSDVFKYNTVAKSLHTRSAIKIQDGCDNFCTFCIIPVVRGRAVSRPIPQIIDNVKHTLDNGFKELVVTGVNIGRYKWEEKRFEDVLEAILNVPGDFRIRISSLEPDGFGDRFYGLFGHPKMAPHLHLCLQSGSDNVLLRMRRVYDVTRFYSIVERFKTQYPDFNFTTDLIVGFPGETDDDFLKSMDAVARLGFSHVHTFKYSVREGTRAARMDNKVHGKIMSERSARVRELADEIRLGYLSHFTGRQQTVLVETIDAKGFARGYGEHYVPVRFKANGSQPNTFQKVIIRKLEGTGERSGLVGELVRSDD